MENQSSHIMTPHEFVDSVTWSQAITKAATSNVYDSSTKSIYKEFPSGCPLYAKISMTGGGWKIATSSVNQPLYLVFTETSPISGGSTIKHFYPFPGIPGFSFATCYLPLRNSIRVPGQTSSFSIDVMSSTEGTDDHSAANGNIGQVQVDIFTGVAVERELYTTNHVQASATYSANDKTSAFAFRRANTGSVTIGTNAGQLGYQIQARGHRAYNTTNVNEFTNNITNTTTSGSVSVAPPTTNTWCQPIYVNVFANNGLVTSANLTVIGMIIGGAQ